MTILLLLLLPLAASQSVLVDRDEASVETDDDDDAKETTPTDKVPAAKAFAAYREKIRVDEENMMQKAICDRREDLALAADSEKSYGCLV